MLSTRCEIFADGSFAALCCSGGDILALRVGHLASLVFGVNMHGRDRVEGRIIVQVEITSQIKLSFYPV